MPTNADAIVVLDERLQQLENKDPRLDLQLDELDLSVRAYWTLVHGGLKTPRQILEYGLDRLEMLRGAGTKTVQEIRSMIDRLLSGDQTVIRPHI
jgi:DNA-directed RNA polymerase alpha subunit